MLKYSIKPSKNAKILLRPSLDKSISIITIVIIIVYVRT